MTPPVPVGRKPSVNTHLTLEARASMGFVGRDEDEGFSLSDGVDLAYLGELEWDGMGWGAVGWCGGLKLDAWCSVISSWLTHTC
jgi:hypothetical protein